MSCTNLATKFVVMTGGKTAEKIAVSPSMYEELDRDYNNFKNCELIALHEFNGDWPCWEVHPMGDEVVVLISGAVDFVLQFDEGEQTVELSLPGDYVIVPRGVWHTAKMSVLSKILFVTPGENTQCR